MVKKNLRFGKKIFSVAAKQMSRSAMPNKLFFIFCLTVNDDIHESLDESEIWPDQTTGFHR